MAISWSSKSELVELTCYCMLRVSDPSSLHPFPDIGTPSSRILREFTPLYTLCIDIANFLQRIEFLTPMFEYPTIFELPDSRTRLSPRFRENIITAIILHLHVSIDIRRKSRCPVCILFYIGQVPLTVRICCLPISCRTNLFTSSIYHN